MDSIIDIVPVPVMPWDALICTYSAAKRVVKSLFQLQAEYLAWRFGVKNIITPQLPIIPRGIQSGDFAFNSAEKTTSNVDCPRASRAAYQAQARFNSLRTVPK